ncbi:MAG: FAD-binding protein [Candidatus Altiarchaeota archaeon]
MRIRTNKPLSNHSSLGIGGDADALMMPKDVGELVEAIGFCNASGLDYVVVGSGSAVLFSDKGFRGCVIVTSEMGFVDFRKQIAEAEAGVQLARFIDMLAERWLGGMEKLYGIPGTIGGAAYTNASYKGTSIGQFIHSIMAVDSEGIVVEIPQKDVGFSYKRGYWGGTILSVKFDLTGLQPSAGIRQALDSQTAQRANSLPVGKKACRMFENVGGDSTALLIERCGLAGLRIGGAALWAKQPNYVVNVGGAKADDVITLVKRVSDGLERKLGLDVSIGIRVIGEL